MNKNLILHRHLESHTPIKFVKGADIQLSKNFHLSEFECKCIYKSCDYTLVDMNLINILQMIRNKCGIIAINSGYRCERHNSDEGGSDDSYHLKGKASDIISANYSPSAIHDIINSLLGDYGGLMLYISKKFNHIDVRLDKYRSIVK